jgi:RNA polymerase sigma-70 factor, ECF subfamily
LDEVTLNRLMDRLVDGDREAFTPLYEALHPRALAVARRRLSLTPADAEDAAQRIMTTLFARAVEFTPGRPVLPWFYAIAANETHAVARKKKLQTAREGHLSDPALHAIAADGSDQDPEEALSLAEMRELLREAIRALDPLSAATIEGQLVASTPSGPLPPTVRKRLSRAYARLRLLLASAYGSP